MKCYCKADFCQNEALNLIAYNKYETTWATRQGEKNCCKNNADSVEQVQLEEKNLLPTCRVASL